LEGGFVAFTSGSILRTLLGAGMLWLAATVAADARTIKLLVLGDSLAAGYGLPPGDGFQPQLAAALKARGLDVQLIDGAVSGDTTAGGRARLDWALGDGADAAIVELGGNDGLRGIEPSDTQANLAAILDELTAKHVKILLSGMKSPPNLGNSYGESFENVYQRLGARPDVLFDPFFLAGVAANPALNQPDGIHPTKEGVKIILARLLPLILRLIGEVPSS
jgi:acyl-CoA thioesterase-1